MHLDGGLLIATAACLVLTLCLSMTSCCTLAVISSKDSRRLLLCSDRSIKWLSTLEELPVWSDVLDMD